MVEFLRDSDVSPRTNADLLRFTVHNGDDAVARRLANSYARAFTQYKFDLDTGQVRKARQELVKRLDELRRAGDTQSAQYRELLDSERELRTLELLQVQSPIVERATRAPQTAPRPIRSVLLGAMLGAILGLGLAFLWEALDKRVRTEEEIERRLDLPLLSRVPAPGKRVRDEGQLSMLSTGQDASAEAIRRLRTNLEFALLDRDIRVLMVTSAVQQEGKSTTVSNLAVALARSGRDVALVDLDLRRPLVADLFGVRRLPGLTDVVPSESRARGGHDLGAASRGNRRARSRRTGRARRADYASSPLGIFLPIQGSSSGRLRSVASSTGSALSATSSSSTPHRSCSSETP